MSSRRFNNRGAVILFAIALETWAGVGRAGLRCIIVAITISMLNIQAERVSTALLCHVRATDACVPLKITRLLGLVK